ncbi:hypothetical protein [Pseudonocardia sp. WMMC193]|uniref:hypothetical protein n=1 Tax=Pseudonocardia sp. WMMC193 TaxID=2911965 RepID=UPI001F35E1B1|nr:hypothetical protein [Pseudonocardia sp. WMMC193]MCF7548514.1 hypothetical protein [Pseudonocardia sp. WMMC193]
MTDRRDLPAVPEQVFRVSDGSSAVVSPEEVAVLAAKRGLTVQEYQMWLRRRTEALTAANQMGLAVGDIAELLVKTEMTDGEAEGS